MSREAFLENIKKWNGFEAFAEAIGGEAARHVRLMGVEASGCGLCRLCFGFLRRKRA